MGAVAPNLGTTQINVTHFATPKSDKDDLDSEEIFLMHGFSFHESRSSSQKLKSGWQAYFYFWYLKQFTSKDAHQWNVFLLLFLFVMNH